MWGRAIGWARGDCGSEVKRMLGEDEGLRDRSARANLFGALLSRCRVCCSLVETVLAEFEPKGRAAEEDVPRKLGLFCIWTSSFFSSGSPKKAFPCSITSWTSESSIPAFLM